jgi:uncharacterized protein (TIRG00374 family)
MEAGQPTPPISSGVARSRSLAREFRAPRQSLLIAFGSAISLLSLWLVLRHVSLHEVWTSLEGAHWIWLVPSIGLTYLTLWVRAIRWRHLFLDPQRVATWESAKAINVGLLFNNILPSRAGEVPRVLGLARGTGLSKVEIGATVVVERALDLLTIALIAVVAWPWLPSARWVQALCVICAFIVSAFVVGTVLLVVMRRRARRLAERALGALPFVSADRALTLTASAARGVHVVAKPRRLALAIALSALVWTVTALSVFVLLPAFDLHATFTSAWLIAIVTSLALTVPSTSGGLGVYEAGVQASLVAFGASAGSALSFALVLHAVNFLPVSITGVLASWSYVASPGTPSRAVADTPSH